MFQRRCTTCLTSWHQKVLSARSRRNYVGTWQPYTQTYPSSTCHPKRVLPPSSAIPTTTSYNLWNNPRRHLSAVSHTAPSTLNITGNAKPVSEAQRRSAQLELDQMSRSTSRLLAMNLNTEDSSTATSEAVVNEARVALHYWSRRWYMHFHPGFGRAAKGSTLSLGALRKWDKNNLDGGDGMGIVSDGIGLEESTKSDDAAALSIQNLSGDHGAQQAELLLDWALSNNLVPHGIFDHSFDAKSHMEKEDKEGGNLGISPNLTCVNIIETYLLPTAYAGVGGGGGDDATTAHGSDGYNKLETLRSIHDQRNFATLAKHFTINSSYIRAVVDATRVMKKMKQLQSDFPDQLSSDALSLKAELNIWSKRAIILGKNQTGHGGGGIVAGSIKDGVANSRTLELLELEDACNIGGQMGDDAYTLQGCLDKMESIVSEAEERYISTKDERIRPSVDWYNHVLGAWARSDLEGALEKTKQILRGMEAYDNTLAENLGNYNTDNGNLRQCWASPDTITYNSVLFCLTRDPGQNRAKEAEVLLKNMKFRYEQTKNKDMRPDEVTYGAVLHALAQAGMAREAESFLDSLEDAEQDEAIVPSLTIYNTVLNAWANSSQRNAPKKADALLTRMKVLSSTGKNSSIEPDPISISTVISCHARSKTRQGAERGEQMLDEALAMYSEGNPRVKPDSIMFNCAITGWTNISGMESGEEALSSNVIPAERAEMLLRKMKETQLSVHPVAQTFNIILDCWAKSETKGAAERALKLMREMLDYGVAPDECSYNSVLHAMTKETNPKWVAIAEDMFQEMKEKVSISDITYHVMMNIYCKSSDSDGARKAEALLRNMEKEKLHPSQISYNICIDACARRGDHRKAESLLQEMLSLSDKGNIKCRPTIHSFASVVNALAKSGDADAVTRAKEVVCKVEELEYVSPNSILYNSLIDCIVKSRNNDNASSEAEEILLRMEQNHRAGNSNVRPNSYTYSMVMTCCARSKDPGSAERAERILMNMESLYAEGLSDAAANGRCYSAAISAWARSHSPNAVERTFALIDRMEKNGRDAGPHGKPNAHCYNACIHAIAKSQKSGKAKQCRDVLQRMIAARDGGFRESAPSLITYSTIINACAFTHGDEEDQKEAFDLARTCFQTLLESNEIEPCASCFTNFFHVITRHLKHGAIRDQFAEAVFLEGCKRGKISKQVLHNFRKASPSVANRILSEHRILPEAWQNKIKNDGYKSY